MHRSVVLFLLAAGPLAAQAPPHPVLAFADSIEPSTDTATLRALAPDTSRIMPSRLRAAFALARLGEVTGDRHTLDQAIDRFTILTEQVDNTLAWYGWTGVEIWKSDHDRLRQPSRHQHVRPDYLIMSERLLRRTLEGDSALRKGAVSVAFVSLFPKRHADPASALAAVRLLPDSVVASDTSFLLSVGRIERDAAAEDSALSHFRAYVRAGGDSAVGLLEQARVLFDMRRDEEASRAWYAGAAHARSEAGRGLYRSDVEWVASPEELASFDSLPADSLRPWLAGFWARREATDGRRPGERLAEHYRRWFYAMRNFQLLLPWRWFGDMSVFHSTQRIIDDRGLVYIHYGEPNARASYAGGASSLAAGNATSMTPVLNDDTQSLQESNAATLRGMAEQNFADKLEGADTLNRIRVPPNESWRYDLPEGPLVLHFVGQAPGDYKLVESLADIFGFSMGTRITSGTFDLGRTAISGDDRLAFARGLFESRAGLDPSYGLLAMSPSLGRGARLSAERKRGHEAIARATTTDRYVISFDRPLDAIVQTYALGARDRIPSQVLVEFAVPGQRVIPGGWVHGTRPFYPVDVWVRVTRNGQPVAESDTMRRFTVPRELKPDQYVYGLISLPVPPGRYAIQVVLSQPLGGAGVATRRDSVVVPGPADSLVVSDLVMGRRGSGLGWRRADAIVPLNPLNGFPHGGTAEVYWEVGGLTLGTVYQTAIEIRRQDRNDAKVSLGFTDRADGNPSALSRSISLDRLDPGAYTLTVRVTSGTLTVTRSAPLFVTGKERFNTAREVGMRSAPPGTAPWPRPNGVKHPFKVESVADNDGSTRIRVVDLALVATGLRDTLLVSAEMRFSGSTPPPLTDSIDVRWIVERPMHDSLDLRLADPEPRRAALLLDDTHGIDLGVGDYGVHSGREIVIYHMPAGQWPAVLDAKKLTALLGDRRIPLDQRKQHDALADLTRLARP